MDSLQNLRVCLMMFQLNICLDFQYLGIPLLHLFVSHEGRSNQEDGLTSL